MMSKVHFLCLLLSLSWCFPLAERSGKAYAQNTTPGIGSTDARPETLSTGKPESSDVIWIRSAAGELVPVLKTPQLEELLNDFLKRKQKSPAEPQNWGISSLSLDGVLDGDQVAVSATLQVQLLVDGTWIRVPIRFNEAVMKEYVYVGPGESTHGGIDPDQGYQWWLRGKGTHTLTLKLLVPLTKQDFPSRRLQLSLPPTVISDLKLTLPVPRITAKLDDNSRARMAITSSKDSTSMIQLWGLGTKLDLSWQAQPEVSSVETVLETRTAITATIDGQSILMEANQRYVALQGSFQQVQVKLPRGGELLKVSGELYQSTIQDPSTPQLVTVNLKESVTGTTPVELRWTVRVEIPSKTERILLEGFEVSKAKIQTGHLAVRLVGDFRLERIDEQNQFVQRENFSTLEKALPLFPTREDVSSAYAILRQPFQLAVNLQPEKPHVTAKPRLYLSMTPEKMELVGEYDVRVYRGGIERIQFEWPGWKEEGWKVDPVSPPSMIEETKLDDLSGIPVKLINRATNNSEQLTLQLRASRSIPTGTQNIELTLPGISDVNLTPGELAVVVADNLDVDLRSVDAMSPKLSSVAQTTGITLPKDLTELRRRDYRLDLSRGKLSLSMTLQKQKISTQSDVTLSLDGTDLQMIQRIAYDVAYERLSQILLMVPTQVLERAEFELVVEGNSKPLRLTPIATGAVEGDRRQQRLALESGRLGKFQILIKSTLPIKWPDESTNEPLLVPLVISDDSSFSSLHVHLLHSRHQRLELLGESWIPHTSLEGESVWQTTQKHSSIPLKLEQSDARWRRGVIVTRRLAQAAFAPNGEVFCQVQYQIEGMAKSIVFTVPQGITNASFRWNGSRIDPGKVVELAGIPGQFQLAVPEVEWDSEEKQLLTITYRSATQSPLGIISYRGLEIPDVQCRESPTLTFWQILLPSNQQLWTLPRGFLAEFDWALDSLIWTRRQRHTMDSLKEWIGDSSGSPATSNMAYTNRYVFSSLDPRNRMSFRLMSTSLTVLIGASLALVLGFLLVHVPATRHVLTFLSLGFFTALAALWEFESVMVLLQPAAIGVALSLLASISQQAFRRPAIEPVLTLASSRNVQAAPSSRHDPEPEVPAESVTRTHSPLAPIEESGVGP